MQAPCRLYATRAPLPFIHSISIAPGAVRVGAESSMGAEPLCGESESLPRALPKGCPTGMFLPFSWPGQGTGPRAWSKGFFSTLLVGLPVITNTRRDKT